MYNIQCYIILNKSLVKFQIICLIFVRRLLRYFISLFACHYILMSNTILINIILIKISVTKNYEAIFTIKHE